MIRLVKLSNNLHKIILNDFVIYFSYETPIAFYNKSLVISNNIWSSTTGKHLNIINADKSYRIDNVKFAEELNKAVKNL